MNLEAMSLPSAVSVSTLVSLCHLEALQVQLDPSFVQTFPWPPPNTVTMKVLTVGYKAWPLFSAASPTQTLPLLGLDYLPNPPRATPSDSSGLNSKAPLGTSLGDQGLRLCTANSGRSVSIPGQGTGSHLPRLRPGVAKLKRKKEKSKESLKSPAVMEMRGRPRWLP